MTLNEEWRGLPGREGEYEVSNLGRVRSLRRVITMANGRPRTTPARVLRPGVRKTGRRYVHLGRDEDGFRKTLTVCRAVALTFLGEPPEGTVVCHRDDNKANNAVPNLYWGTRSQNNYDMWRNGRRERAQVR